MKIFYLNNHKLFCQIDSPVEAEESRDTNNIRTEHKSEDTRHDIAHNLSVSCTNKPKDTPIEDINPGLPAKSFNMLKRTEDNNIETE